MRGARDELAWSGVALAAETGEVRVVTVGAAAGEPIPPGLEDRVFAGLSYDRVVELMEWADKVVVW